MQEINLDWILTKVKNILRFVPDDGAVGQILRRTAHGAEWSDEQGAGGSVTSVNGMQGAVVLTAADVGALPDTYAAPVDSVNGQTGAVVLDAGDVGALPDTTVIPTDTSDLTNTAGFVDAAGAAAAAPVQSVNGQTGAVSLSIPTDTGDLTNGAGFVTAAGAAAAAPVQSVNGQTGAVVTTGKTTYSPTVTKTSGNSSFYSGAAVECSGAVTLSLTFTNGSDTSAGGNAFVGTLSNAPLPYSESVGIGFYGTHVFALAVRPDGSFNVRVLVGGGYWSATDRHTVCVTYIAA